MLVFLYVCKRRGLKVDAGKSKVVLLGGEEGLKCDVCVDGTRLEHVSQFKYLGCVLDESGTYEAKYSKKVASERRVAGAITYLWLMLRVYSLNVLGSCMSCCWCLFIRRVVRQ